MAGDMNNNQIESFNWNTLRARQEPTRRIKREDSTILTGMRIHHNFVRPHQGMSWDTLAHRARIRISGDNKWKTIIQNTCKDT